MGKKIVQYNTENHSRISEKWHNFNGMPLGKVMEYSETRGTFKCVLMQN